MSSSCGGRRNMWNSDWPSTAVPGIQLVLQEVLVKGLKLQTRYRSPRTTLSQNLMSSWGLIWLYHFQNGECFTSARLCPVERLPSRLHANADLATILTSIRSGPSTPHYMCQWVCRLCRVKLAVICGTRSALRLWSCSNSKRCCQRIHSPQKKIDDLISMFRVKQTLYSEISNKTRQQR